jgi:hypothetical protein
LLRDAREENKRRKQETRNKMSSEQHCHLLQGEEKTNKEAKEEEAKEEEPYDECEGGFPIVRSTPNHLLWTMWHQTTSQLKNPNHNRNLVTANTVVSLRVSFWSGKRSSSVLLISCILRSPISRNRTTCTGTCRISFMALWARAIISPCLDVFNKASGICSLQRITRASSLALLTVGSKETVTIDVMMAVHITN